MTSNAETIAVNDTVTISSNTAKVRKLVTTTATPTIKVDMKVRLRTVLLSPLLMAQVHLLVLSIVSLPILQVLFNTSIHQEMRLLPITHLAHLHQTRLSMMVSIVVR